jgi:ParB family chromosome partitioning protein
MADAGWRPTVATYLGRVTKARILEAVREAKGEQAAQLIENLKKADMAREAERLLDSTGWGRFRRSADTQYQVTSSVS